VLYYYIQKGYYYNTQRHTHYTQIHSVGSPTIAAYILSPAATIAVRTQKSIYVQDEQCEYILISVRNLSRPSPRLKTITLCDEALPVMTKYIIIWIIARTIDDSKRKIRNFTTKCAYIIVKVMVPRD